MKILTPIKIAGCAVLCAVASLHAQPSITAQPVSQTVASGSNATFSVTAVAGTGTNLTYQWNNGSNIAGATNKTYQTGTAGSYYVVVTDAGGSTNSSTAVLTVCTTPTVTDPASINVVKGATTNLSVTATGNALSYKWTKNGQTTVLSTNSTCPLDTSAVGTNGYRVVVSNVAGSVTSAVGLVTVVAAPVITTQPTDKTIAVGSNWVVTVACANKFGTYTWYYNGTNVLTGSTTNTLTVLCDSTNKSGAYSLVLSNFAGVLTSSNAILTVLEKPAITAQPQDTTVVTTSNATLSVTATGVGLNYAWKLGTATVKSSSSSSYTFSTNKFGVYNFTVLITNAVGSITSSVAKVTVLGIPTITTNLTDKTIGLGSNYTFKLPGVNNSGDYSWYYCTNGGNTNLLASGTNNFYTLTNAQYADQGSYWAVLSNAVGTLTSATCDLTVLQSPSFAANLSCTNGDLTGSTNSIPTNTVATLNATAAGDSLSYFWMTGTNVLSTAATNSITVATPKAGKYVLVLSNAVCKATSSPVTLVIIGPPAITAKSGVTNLIVGQNLGLSVTASGTKPYTNLVYQWSQDGSSISGATNASLSVTNVDTNAAGLYKVVVSNFGGSTTSSVFNVSVKLDTNAPAVAITVPAKALTNLSYTVKGTAKDNVLVTNVVYSLNGSTNLVAATSITNNWAQWSADLTLVPGSNTVVAIASDYSGNTGKTTNVLLCAPFYTANITSSDSTLGTITGNTNLVQWGSTYTMTASPKSRILFTGWSGLSGLTTTNSTNSLVLKFKVTTNVVGVANFATNNFFDAAGTYNGLFYDTNGVDFASAGSIKVSITTNLAYSGSLVLAGSSINLGGQIAADGTTTANLQSNLTLSFAMGSQQLTGTLTTASGTSVILADLAYFSKSNLATAYSGGYTMVIPPDTNGPASAGYGYANVTVSTNGDITMVGKAADGSAISQSVPVAQDGSWPLFVPLYKTTTTVSNSAPVSKYNGEMIGWVTFANNGFNTKKGPSGNITWIKTAYTNSGLYASGFTNDVSLLSSPFKAPTTLAPKVLPELVWGSIWFTDGSLTNDIGNWMFVSKSGAAYADDSSTTIAFSQTGGVSGKFSPDGTTKTISYSGIVLQNTTNAFGFFLGTNSVGSVQIDAVPTALTP